MNYSSLKRSIQEEDVTIANIYTPNIGAGHLTGLDASPIAPGTSKC